MKRIYFTKAKKNCLDIIWEPLNGGIGFNYYVSDSFVMFDIKLLPLTILFVIHNK